MYIFSINSLFSDTFVGWRPKTSSKWSSRTFGEWAETKASTTSASIGNWKPPKGNRQTRCPFETERRRRSSQKVSLMIWCPNLEILTKMKKKKFKFPQRRGGTETRRICFDLRESKITRGRREETTRKNHADRTRKTEKTSWNRQIAVKWSFTFLVIFRIWLFFCVCVRGASWSQQ